MNGSNRSTTYVSTTELEAAISESDTATGKSVVITVYNAEPGGGLSNEVPFNVVNPAPTITSITPDSVDAGSGAFILSVTGSGFVPGSKVRWNGGNCFTTYISTNDLKAVIHVGAQGGGSPAPPGGFGFLIIGAGLQTRVSARNFFRTS